MINKNTPKDQKLMFSCYICLGFVLRANENLGQLSAHKLRGIYTL